MRKYINHIPLTINIIAIIFMSLTINGVFESEDFLNFRISNSKRLLMIFSYSLLANFVLGVILNFKKEKWKYLLLLLITSIIYFLLISPFYNKISPW